MYRFEEKQLSFTDFNQPQGLQMNSDLENGEPFMSCNVPTIVKATMPGTGAEKAGFQEGDKLVAVNGVATPSFTQFTEQLKKNRT